MRRVRSRRRRTYALRGTGTAVACLALTGGGIAIASTLKGQGFAPAASPSGDSTTSTTAAGKPVTVLVVRVDLLEHSDAPDTPGLDSALLVHFSADRSRVEVVPLSKYAELDTSGCALGAAASSDAPLSLVQAFSAATAGEDLTAGLRCLMTAVTVTTGVDIDGYAVTDFAGFMGDVNGLGGVEVCVPEAISAPRSHLELSAGWHKLDGSKALALARTREGAIESDSDDRYSREGRVYAAILEAVLASPNTSLSTSEGPEVLNSLLDEVRMKGTWTVQAVAAPQVLPLDAAVAPFDSNAQAVFDALAADRPGALLPAGCQ